MNKVRTIDSLPLDGGLLCLDFVNTVQTRKKTPSHEYLPDYPTFLDWCKKVDLISDEEIKKLRDVSNADRWATEKAFRYILNVRDAFYTLFSQRAAGHKVGEAVLETFNDLLSVALSHLGLANDNGGLKQVWLKPGDDLTSPLWPIIKSAYDTLVSPQIRYVKECSACGWLFLDTTRSHTRRWCNPLECGSTDKAMRYYHRQKKTARDTNRLGNKKSGR